MPAGRDDQELNWTPEGQIGALLRTVGRFAPSPPPGATPRPRWGSEEHVRELFIDRVELHTLRRDNLEVAAFEQARDRPNPRLSLADGRRHGGNGSLLEQEAVRLPAA